MFLALKFAAFVASSFAALWASNKALDAMTGRDFMDFISYGVNLLFSVGSSLVLEFVNYVASILPSSDGLPTQVMYASNQITPYFSIVNAFLPLDTVLFLVSFVLITQASLWGVMIALKVFGWARGVDYDASKFALFVDPIPDHISYTDKRNQSRVMKYLNKK